MTPSIRHEAPLRAASESARQALEALMTTEFKDTFVDRLLAEG